MIPASPDTDTSPVSGRDGGPASSWTRSQGRGCARPASEGSLDESPSRLDYDTGEPQQCLIPGRWPTTGWVSIWGLVNIQGVAGGIGTRSRASLFRAAMVSEIFTQPGITVNDVIREPMIHEPNGVQ